MKIHDLHKTPKIILINGKKRSGKDFFASKLQEELYKNKKTSEIMSFADPLKDIVAKTLNVSLEELDQFKNDKEPIIVRKDGFQEIVTDFRKALQIFGTEAMKPYFGNDVWSNLLLERAKNSKVDFILVPDFRFKVEEISEYTVKIRNDEIDNACKDLHPSETELNDFNFKYTINNSGNPDLTEQINNFIRTVL